MSDEEWPHMWDVHLESGTPDAEWWECTCGARGLGRDPHDQTSWGELWWEVAQHLVAVGQLPDPLPDENPTMGGGRGQNLLYAFRVDGEGDNGHSHHDRRTVRRYHELPPSPTDQSAAWFESESRKISPVADSVDSVSGVRFISRARLVTLEARRLLAVQATLAGGDTRYAFVELVPGSDPSGLGTSVVSLWVADEFVASARAALQQAGFQLSDTRSRS